MINLLPPEEKQKLLILKKERLAMVLGIVVLVALICMTLILLAIKFYILMDTDYQRSILSQADKSQQASGSAGFNAIIKKYNVILVQLDSFYTKEIYFSRAMDIINGVEKPKNLYITNFSLIRDKTGKIQMSLYGISDTRNNLLTFKNNIERDKGIINPSFSPDSWIRPKNANFSLTFEIHEAQK